jgi:hypothetical protein
MLSARRDDHPHTAPFAPSAPPRSLVSRFAGGMQLIGSIIGVPLALIGGYSTYHTTFSPEAKCQSLRGSIVAMLDKQADATTLRMLVQRDVASFQRDCGEVDPDAVAAFKNLMTGAHVQSARRAERHKNETVVAKTDAAAKAPVKAETAKPEAVKDEAAPKAEAAKKVQAAAVAAKHQAEKPAHEVKDARADKEPTEIKEAKPIETASIRSDAAQIDSAWISSVRDALRESAARPFAIEPQAETAAPMPPPIVVSAPPNPAPRREASVPRPPAELAPRAESKEPPPVPPEAIPDADAAPASAD